MGSIIYRENRADLDAEEVIAIDEAADEHQVTIEMQSATTITTGTIALAVRPRDCTDPTPVVGSDGAALALDMAAGPHTIRFNGRFIELTVTPSNDYDGDTFSVAAKGW